MLWSATNPEPPYTALHRLIRGEWWLPPTLVRTDEAGRVRVRGFLGDYQLRIAQRSTDFALRAGQSELALRV